MTTAWKRAMAPVMLGAATMALLASIACTAKPDVMSANGAASNDAAMKLERGKYLVAIGGCNDCHTPLKMGPKGPEPDMSRYLSGHPEGLVMPSAPRLEMPWGYAGSATNTAFAGPWGISYAINLTSHETTGLGQWTENGFVQAMKTGRHLGIPTGRPILPPMPQPAFSNMTEEDLKAVFAFLRTVPAIKNTVPEAVLAPPPMPPDAPAAPPAPSAPSPR